MATSRRSTNGVRVKARVNSFFDSDLVIQRIGKARVKYLNRAGGRVRKVAVSKLSKSKHSSQPGEAPKSHGSQQLRRKLFYAIDPRRDDAVVGPEKIDKPGQVPATLEHGGDAELPIVRFERQQDGTFKRVVTDKKKIVHVAARPFMGPSLDEIKPQLSKLWADTVTA